MFFPSRKKIASINNENITHLGSLMDLQWYFMQLHKRQQRILFPRKKNMRHIFAGKFSINEKYKQRISEKSRSALWINMTGTINFKIKVYPWNFGNKSWISVKDLSRDFKKSLRQWISFPPLGNILWKSCPGIKICNANAYKVIEGIRKTFLAFEAAFQQP